VLLPGADLELLEKAEAKIFDRFWGRTMTELREISPEEIREFTTEFRELIYALPFQIPHDLIFLGRTVGILSGMCTGLDPEFNIWKQLAPYAQKMILEEARTGRETWLGELETLARAFLTVPRKMDSILSKMERGEIAVRTPEINQKVSLLEKAVRQVTGGLIFLALLLGGIQLFLAGQSTFSQILLAGAALSLIWVFMYGRKI
jgi:predicted unusual protein kinase regulating ubiquinone biosynthesis (AarF/ABC1/UbiB family)